MVVVDGLQVQIDLVDGNNLDWQELEEYKSVTCIHKTSGLSVHRAVCLPLGERFQISLEVDKTCFEWANANALRLRIDFDNRSEIKDFAVVMARPSLANTINARILSVAASGNEYVQLCYLARPIKPTNTSRNGTHEMFDEEVASFTTVPMQSQGRRHTPKREGTVTIAIDRCQLSTRPRRLAAVSPLEYKHTEKASEHALRDAGIHSEAKLFDRTSQSSISPTIASLPSTRLTSFISTTMNQKRSTNWKLPIKQDIALRQSKTGNTEFTMRHPSQRTQDSTLKVMKGQTVEKQ